MKKTILILCFLLHIFVVNTKTKVLHLTFHEGCLYDIEEVAKELNLELTSWMIQHLEPNFWEGFQSGNEIYNVGPKRADRVWNRHKDFFNQFDVIITSDTAPLSRIFLQNNWKKPLIIWVCNRFDYAHESGAEEHFPDRQYYELIREASNLPNVRIIPNTPYETIHAAKKGVNIGSRVIKPIGKKELHDPNFNPAVPESIIKKETLFIYKRLQDHNIKQIQAACNKLNIKTWTGWFSGLEELQQFKGVIYFPYQPSTFALFENLAYGIIHFVPTIEFQTRLRFRTEILSSIQWSEWHSNEFSDVLVYFNSWEDLKHKLESLNFDQLKIAIKKKAMDHRNTMLDRWKSVFEELKIYT